MGKFIVLIIIILVLVGGSYYFFFAERGAAPTTETGQPSSASPEELGASNEPAAIEQELKATELNNLDKEFADIDTQLNTALEETGR
jgi:hypothetical protein